MASLKGLITLSLLHLCVQSSQADVNCDPLAHMIQYFDDNVQPVTRPDVQYAIAIAVPQDQCTQKGAVIEKVFSTQDAKYVKDLITTGVPCVLCTPSQNVIATRPKQKQGSKDIEHAEHVLLFPLGNSPMDKLLKKADQNSCVVFYTYNSPCVTKCIQREDNILPGLANWKNIRKGGMNVFVFEKIWQKDTWRKDMEKDLLKIDAEMPLYRCNKTEDKPMGCEKCEDENTGKVIPYCLPEKKSVLFYFRQILLSMMKFNWHGNK